MINHVFTWTTETEAAGRSVLDELSSLTEEMKGTYESFRVTCHTGPDGAQDLCRGVLLSSFTDAEALERYLYHPTHVAVVDKIKHLFASGVAVDFEE